MDKRENERESGDVVINVINSGPLVFDGNDITPLPFNNTITVNVYVQN